MDFSRTSAAALFLLCAVRVIAAADAAPPVRADMQTTLLDLSPHEVSVTRFLTFRVLADSRVPPRLLFFQAVEGVPDEIRAQVMAGSAFERRYLGNGGSEQAFHRQAACDLRVRQCLFAEIGANGGPPAWLLLWKRWPLEAPAIVATAAPEGPVHASALHAVADLRAVRYSELREVPEELRPALRKAVHGLKEPYVIAVSVAPAFVSEDEALEMAVAGIRLSYRVGLDLEAAEKEVRVPPLVGPHSRTVALSRTYVSAPSGMAATGLSAGAGSSVEPRHLVERVAEMVRGRRLDPSAAKASWMATHSLDNATIQRHVALSASAEEGLTLRLRPAGFPGLGVLRRTLGELILVALWPVAALLYMGGVFWGARAFRWLTSRPLDQDSPREFALCAVLFPLLTPWIALRWVCKDSVADEPNDGDALSVLPFQEYKAVARLVVWALLVAVNWAVLESVAGLGMWLRFG